MAVYQNLPTAPDWKPFTPSLIRSLMEMATWNQLAEYGRSSKGQTRSRLEFEIHPTEPHWCLFLVQMPGARGIVVS